VWSRTRGTKEAGAEEVGMQGLDGIHCVHVCVCVCVCVHVCACVCMCVCACGKTWRKQCCARISFFCIRLALRGCVCERESVCGS